ncbi:helix-turn-helix domain-containing protein [Corynebacterium ulcerans]|uniref:helix-turn-helix domain-containing protein n=1 Tax=Corynebacterium ulcerans TaxID=65058 RepID=UPI0018D65A25|nr:helix-turn-helix domain-containing protein [Corynebacterium ulcerans]MBH5297514.1 excisionase family DNA-binding protein [Corynebacterium ulcerans]
MPTKISPRSYESLQDSARRIGVAVKTLRRWIAQGKITAYRPSARVIRLDAAEVDAMMDATASTRWNEVA